MLERRKKSSMQECLKRCGFRKTTPCPKGWGEPLVTPWSQHSHTLGCLNTWGCGGSADKAPWKCCTWGYLYCRQADLPEPEPGLAQPLPTQAGQDPELLFLLWQPERGRIWLKATHAHASLEHSKHPQQQREVRQENLNTARESHQPGPRFRFHCSLV